MTEIPDLSTEPYIPAVADRGKNVRMIGWLGTSVPSRSKGTVSSDCLQAIKYYMTAHRRDDGFLGNHTCEICTENPAETHGEFFIDLAHFRYVMPQMLVHYIEAHGYRPPDEFLMPLERHWREQGKAMLRMNPHGRCVLTLQERSAFELVDTPERE